MKIPSGFDKRAWERVGGLSTPSKMPGYAYSLPASMCKTGGVLHNKAGSVCEKCYALKGRYNFPKVQDAMLRRYHATFDPTWVPDMVTLLRHAVSIGSRHFRWHDSGDLHSTEHLNKIKAIAHGVPDMFFWLPTREVDFVRRSVYPNAPNLTIRESCHFIDAYYPSKNGNPTSTVHSGATHHTVPMNSHVCPASQQGGKCGSCRACWDPAVQNVSYPKH